jgi:hypothetical protein
MNCGQRVIVAVYAIIENFSGKIYIGASTNYHERESSHRRELLSGRHPNKALQADFNKSGDISFKVIRRCKSKDLPSVEREYIHRYNSNNPNCGYNQDNYIDKYDWIYALAEENYKKKGE